MSELEKEAHDFALKALSDAGYPEEAEGVIYDGLFYGYVTAMKIGKARGQANATAAFQASLPVAMKRFQEVAWDEGADAMEAAYDEGYRPQITNPYREGEQDA